MLMLRLFTDDEESAFDRGSYVATVATVRPQNSRHQEGQA